MSRIDIVPARFTHIGPIASNIRAIDRVECEAYGHSVKQALRDGFMYSEKVWTAMRDGKPIAMFGVYVPSALGGVGHPWLLGTDEVYLHGRELVMLGPAYIEQMCDSISILRNLVSCENEAAIKLLIKWGFTVADETSAVGGVLFRAFENVRSSND